MTRPLSSHYGEQMGDSDVVASIVAGDPDGLAVAYDRYADGLYSYCRSLLREPADAADAVQDTFVIAASRLAGLRDPERLRPWLYAVARNECLRRLRSREAASELADDAERPDETVDVSAEAERALIRALLQDALGGLGPAERDVITQVWHGLDAGEVAMVLGVSRNHAHALLSRARRQLEASLGVLLVARSGRMDCQALHALLTGWDGQLTVPLRKRLERHIGKCAVCSGRRRRELSPELLLGLSPAGMLGAFAARDAAAAHGTAAAHAMAHAAPAALRDQALRMATSKDLHAEAYRGALWRSNGSFGKDGFPQPIRTARPWPPHAPRVYAGAAAGTAAVVAAAIVLATAGGPHHVAAGGSGPTGGPSGGAATPGVPSSAVPSGTAPGASVSPGAQRSAGGAPGATSPARTRTGTAPASGRASSAPPSSALPSSAPPSGGGSPSQRPGPSGQPAPSATSASPSGQPAPSSQPAQGTLAVAPTTIVLTPLLGGSLTLTAENGPVTWSISEPASLLGALTVSPSSGTLTAGQSVQVTIAETGLASLDTTLTVNPGGQQVTVVLGLG